MLKRFLKWLFISIYKVEVKGLDNYEQAGDRVLIVSNHLSFIDAALLSVFLPDDIMFAINSSIAEKWYFKPFLKLAKTFPLDPVNPMATKSIINEVKKNNKCVIFPEGRITVTGSLMKIYEGPGMIADKAHAKILPVRIDGAQYTIFSRISDKVRSRFAPKVTLTILPPQRLDISPEIKGRKRRKIGGDKLYDIMSEMIFHSSDYKKTLFSSLIDQMHIHGRGHMVLEDPLRKPVSYSSMITKSLILGKKIAYKTKQGEYIGLMMPNMTSSVVTFFAMQAYGRVPAMINFPSGEKAIISSCKTAKVKNIITSRKFIISAKLEELVASITKEGIEINYLEDIAKEITIIDKILGFIYGLNPELYLKTVKVPSHEDPAVILFTSGSEGEPKGVVLSHLNIQANRFQLASRIDFGPTDIVFNALPIFHSFGLTGGTLLPILSGIKTFLYPSPLHYKIVPEMVYDTNSTIMFGTNTFLKGYARFAAPYDFYSIRYVFAGAEKLQEETRKTWSERFGARIFEGYGATETSPALSTNTPMHNKPGTVGRILPGIDYSIKAVEGIDEGGKLVVEGPNIMKAYLLSDKPGVLVPPKEGKYDTGDIVSVDEEGYITIKGRAKRFAKIAGEMASLSSVEKYLSNLWPDFEHAVISIADDKKGEALILVTTNESAKKEEISKYAKANGINEISVPKIIKKTDKIPLLGTGKTDYATIQELYA